MVIDPSGDYFGSYNDLDPLEDVTPGPSSIHTRPCGAESDSDSGSGSDTVTDYEDGWEPEIDTEGSDASSRSPSPILVSYEFPEDPVVIPPCQPLPPLPDNFRKPHIKLYPDTRAGAPLLTQSEFLDGHRQYEQQIGQKTNIWAPFTSEIDWRLAKWAKTRGPSSSAFTELLEIHGVADKLGLSYRNVKELDKIIDKHLPSWPQFQRQEVVVQGQVFEIYFRDILQCVKTLYGDANFAPYLKFAPERHFEDHTCAEQLYHDMHTGQWWWSTQEKLDKNAGRGRTIVPLIISSDKTQVTVFRNKTAYPVYLTIGNIPKEIRRKPSKHAYILLGYLPTTSLEHIKSATSRRRSLTNLFHTCMRHIMQPIERPGAHGIVMTSGDGIERVTHPIFAVYIGDYPEQVLVTCCVSGHCPRCTIPRQRVGENTEPHPLRNLRSILEALQMVDQGASVFVKACREAGIKPVFQPFWANLPYSNVYMAITPDLLHQLYQGVFKHLKAWVLQAYGAHEIDARCRRLPPNHNIRLFMKGISTLSRVSGQEHGQMSHFLLGLIADAPLPGGMSNVRLLRCLRGLLDFLFLSQYPVHSTLSLKYLANALERFHASKQIFIDLGIRTDFGIPKIHFMNHYVESVHLFGTFDNFNTEYTERLHIDLAKDAYRSTNRKDEYSQMTKWLERKEKILKHESYMQWVHSGSHPPLRSHWIPPGFNTARTLKMTKHPSRSSVTIQDLITEYGATFFRAALSRFVVQLRNPALSGQRLETASDSLFLGFSRVSVYHRIKFLKHDIFSNASSTADSIHSQPARKDKHGRPIAARFDTALVQVKDSGSTKLDIVHDTRVGQVRVVFSLPEKAADSLFDGIPHQDRVKHLAYIEWFTPFSIRPDGNHGLYKVSRSHVDGGRLASVVDIRRLIRSVHLLPKFGRVANREWMSSTVLDLCPSFFVSRSLLIQIVTLICINSLQTGSV
ncbi:hypothetical protein K435DRAFT_665625 [Dendrothele bispora CBS 962.96]|uniref:CxC2-like cysteine cluster KDZ transposase-associated domain-containing protein n=1 Tax=Dendrothele bispora (strain CBS 962.96) TaxID=1314807 RepID=A0A4V4HFQ3_DENBC|nr:hypothetical protein K435DRAFT_665625 [Dendrothele bispora CBS 962.96]